MDFGLTFSQIIIPTNCNTAHDCRVFELNWGLNQWIFEYKSLMLPEGVLFSHPISKGLSVLPSLYRVKDTNVMDRGHLAHRIHTGH